MEGTSKAPVDSSTTAAQLSSSFTAGVCDTASALAKATVGLVSKEEFSRRRSEIDAAARGEGVAESKSEKKKKKKKAKASTLSFEEEGEEEAEQDEATVSKKPKLGKNPSVNTDFLPDKDREDSARRKREELARVWSLEQDAIKEEQIEVTYSYWDGKGHRYEMTVKKGWTISKFLNKCREQVKELRNASPDQLMYIKEDLIMPHGTTFYDLIVNKARGKSGPLFNFDVHDDVRLINDHRVEKDESHAGKVMDKRLYERNKDKFPYSRFEMFDPLKKWDTYTIHGSETYGEGVHTGLI
eukprot:CAMPEP_0183352712 /NCGR_PEP_ID=MMETSP0164_2-20130417/29951_1 /TAXON_ID=221442 /ORGANISM="Coccolithus pelagicus ssp braarudi, Strain PLY182g" /LENGTH=297 /DNA_ID=CAMNT_0025525217 /DNA_START=14 /DNA_END=907 /DNA_ORIENTATION=-